ncbi:DNA-binding protein [Streptomyces sp. NPDC096012]|uniref:nSTAND1 domain-containing NTPase n=1 Tax=Streptomyces sp. NPDC096012 TaxID=3155684 RepID=UPI00336A8FBE
MAQRTNQGASTLSQAAAGERLPTLPVVLAYVNACSGNPHEWEVRWREAAAEAAADPRAEDADTEPPYRGLARFEAGDAGLFFGRDELTERLLRQTGSRRFTAVFGPSGSGKSSLLRAGLIPRLRTSHQAGTRPAALRVLTPGEHPLDTHAERFVPADGDGDTWLIVDQFEELYTLCTDPGERDQFIDHLIAATDPASRLRVVIAVRADFLGHCATHPQLTTVLQDATVLAGPMSRDELREAIVKPAQTTGLIVERTLTARILDEVEDEPGALPLMSHALLETWRRRNGRALTLTAYEAAGGLHAAIARTAEETYASLTDIQATLARRMLLRLITPGEGTSDTRRPADRGELIGSAPEDARHDATIVLECLARARLITLDSDTVDLAHEALINAWPRLRGWIEAERDLLRTHRQLTEAARTWDDLDRDPGALYRGTRLATAEDAFATPRRRAALTELERSFLSAGLAAAQHERRSAARAARRTRAFVTALSCLVVVALVAALVAWQQNRAGEQQKVQTEARRIAALAQSLRASEPMAALRLSLAAWKIADLTETRSALMGSLAQHNQDAFRIPGRTEDLGTDLSRDGRMAVSVADGRATAWDVRAHRRLSSFHILSGDSLTLRTALSPDGQTLAVGNGRKISLYDMRTGKRTAQLPDLSLASLSFSPSGRTLLVAVTVDDKAAALRLWDVRHHTLLFRSGPNHVNGLMEWTDSPHSTGDVLVASSAVGATVAVSADDRFVADCSLDRFKVWNVKTHRLAPVPPMTLRGTTCTSAQIAFGPHGHELAVTTERGIRMWDAASGTQRPGISHRGLQVTNYTGDGRFIVATDGNDVFLWRLGGTPVLAYQAPAPAEVTSSLVFDQHDGLIRYVSGGAGTTVWSLFVNDSHQPGYRQDVTTKATFSRDGRLLAVVRQSGGKHRLRLIDVARNKPLADGLPTAPCPLEEGTPGCTDEVAFSPDGRTLAYVSTQDEAVGDPLLTVVDIRHPFRRTGFPLPAKSYEWPTVDSIVFDSEHSVLVSLAGERTERWDLRRHRRTDRWPDVSGDPLAVRDDGRLLVSPDGTVTDLGSGSTTPHTLTQSQPTVVALSHDGTRLAAADDTGWVTLWDGDARKRLGDLPGSTTGLQHGGGSAGVSALAFSHDGKTLAVGTDDGQVRLWDVTTRLAIGDPLHGSGGKVMSLAFSDDDRTLSLAGEHVQLEQYDIAPELVSADICRRAAGGLSRSAWRTYVHDIPYRTSC